MSIFTREIIGSTPFLEALESNLSRLSELSALILWGDRDFAFREKQRLRFEFTFQELQSDYFAGRGTPYSRGRARRDRQRHQRPVRPQNESLMTRDHICFP